MKRTPGDPRGSWRGRALLFWEWFFPPRVALPEEALALLRTLYPALRLDRIRFHLGLPHLVRWLGAEAITLPSQWAARRVRVYLLPRAWAPGSIEGLGTVAHEAFHALQIQETAWGFGPFRPFLWLYFACGAANGFRYQGHPLERQAYELAGRASSAFESRLRAAALESLAADFDPASAAARVAPLARDSAGLRFWGTLGQSTPWVGGRLAAGGAPTWVWALIGSPWIGLWLVVWMAATGLAWTAFALIEGVGLVAAGAFRFAITVPTIFRNRA